MAIFLSFLLPIIHNGHTFALTDEQCQGYNNKPTTGALPEGCNCGSKNLSYQEAANLGLDTGDLVYTNCKAKSAEKTENTTDTAADKAEADRIRAVGKNQADQEAINKALTGICSSLEYSTFEKCVKDKKIDTNAILTCINEINRHNDNTNLALPNPTCNALDENIRKNIYDSDLVEKYNDAINDANTQANQAIKAAQAASSGTAPEETDCEQHAGEFSWITCPAIEKGTNAAEDIFQDILEGIFHYDITNDALKEVWSKFVPLGNVVLAIVFLIMIYSLATSTGMSNYTIKKVMPRLVIAAIAINLSFYICAAAVDLSNILGATLKDFIKPPGDISFFEKFKTAGLASIALVVIAFTSLSMIIIAGIVFILLIALRGVLLTIMIVISPVAFALYLLPNTKKWFDMYIKEFSRLLIAYPFISAVWGAAMLTNKILQFSNTVNPVLSFIFTPILVIVPVVAVFPILKMSGNIMSMASNKFNNLGNKGRDAYRGSNYAKNRAQNKEISRAQRRAGQANTNYRTNFRGGRANPANWLNKSRNLANRASNWGANKTLNAIDSAAQKGIPGFAANAGFADSQRTRAANLKEAKDKQISESALQWAQRLNNKEMNEFKTNGTVNGQRVSDEQYIAAFSQGVASNQFSPLEQIKLVQEGMNKIQSRSLRQSLAKSASSSEGNIMDAGTIYGAADAGAMTSAQVAAGVNNFATKNLSGSKWSDVSDDALKTLAANGYGAEVAQSAHEAAVAGNSSKGRFGQDLVNMAGVAGSAPKALPSYNASDFIDTSILVSHRTPTNSTPPSGYGPSARPTGTP